VINLHEHALSRLGIELDDADRERRPRCRGCGNRVASFALTKGEDGAWRCGHCRIDAQRAAEPPSSLSWDDIRGMRTVELGRTDWTQLPDVPEATRVLWSAYRQAWRDVTDQDCPPEQAVIPRAPDQRAPEEK
jgi:hypothetical protein